MEEQLVFDPVDHYWSQGQQQAQDGDLMAAVRSYRKALSLAGPDHPARWRMQVAMGDAYFDARHYQQAETVWLSVLAERRRAVERAWLLWRLGRIALRRRQLQEAEALFDEAAALARPANRLLRTQLLLQRAELARLRHDPAVERACLRRAIRLAKGMDDADAFDLMVFAYQALYQAHKRQKDLPGALKVLQEVYPRLAEAGSADELITPFTDLGIALVRANRPKLAEKAFAGALLCCPDPTTEVYLLSNYASALCEVGKYAEAYLFIQKAIAYADIDDPQSPEFLATLYDTAAYVCVQRGQLEQARMWLQKALDRMIKVPSSPFPVASIYLNLALVEERSGRLEEALAALQQAEAQHPDSPMIRREIERIERLQLGLPPGRKEARRRTGGRKPRR